MKTRAQGFTLIEVMVAMLVAMIGSLALGALLIGSMDSDALARERVAAVNVAKRILEEWAASPVDALPTPACNPPIGQLSVGTSVTCTPATGLVRIPFTISVNVRPVTAPLHPVPADSPGVFKLGPGLRVTALLVDRSQSNRVYAGTEGGGLFVSNDGGATWARSPGMGYLSIHAIVQHPVNASVLFLGTNTGLWDNQGAGGVWRQRGAGTGLTASKITAIAFDPLNANILYVGAYGGVFKSLDGGATWTRVNGTLPTNLTNLAVNDLVVTTDPASGTTVVFAATNGGVFKSADGGASWSLAGMGSTNVHALAVDPANHNIVYAGTITDVRFSTDGGATWTQYFAANADVRALAMRGGAPVMATLRGVFDNGAGPKITGIADQGGIRTYALAIDPANASIWYAGTDQGLYKSTDAGGSWTAIGGNPALATNGLNENGFGIDPKEKVVSVSWLHKGKTHTVSLTHITWRPFGPRPVQ